VSSVRLRHGQLRPPTIIIRSVPQPISLQAAALDVQGAWRVGLTIPSNGQQAANL